MSAKFKIAILASDHPFYQGECDMLVFPGMDGECGVLANHEPMVTCLRAGELRYKLEDEWYYAAVSDGFVEITPDGVMILADTIECPEDIDLHRAEEAKIQAEEKLRQKLSIMEYYQTMAALNRAMNRLRVVKKRIK